MTLGLGGRVGRQLVSGNRAKQDFIEAERTGRNRKTDPGEVMDGEAH